MCPHKQVILAWLIFRANQQGTCFPSVEKLCEDTGIKSRTTVTRHLKELEEKGYIKSKIRLRDDGGQTSNEYAVFIRRQGGVQKGGEGAVQKLNTNYKNSNQKNITKEKTGSLRSVNGELKPTPKPKTKPFTAPMPAEVEQWARGWAKDKGYDIKAVVVQASKAFEYYRRLDWQDSNGKKVKSWKMKIAGVWLSEDKLKKAEKIDFKEYGI
jgi:DNA-binding transcriptional MocR family regulator